jgi:hypothetical protein
MADAAGDHEKLAGVEPDITAVRRRAADGELTAKYEEHLVFGVVAVPGEVALDAGDLDELVVNATKNPRQPQRHTRGGELAAREFKGDRMGLHQGVVEG